MRTSTEYTKTHHPNLTSQTDMCRPIVKTLELIYAFEVPDDGDTLLFFLQRSLLFGLGLVGTLGK
jgi:hypothetical protein